MNRIVFFSLTFSFFVFNAFSQDMSYISGARSRALAESTTTFTDHWAAMNNQAGLAFVPSFGAGVFFENRFNMRELNTAALVMAVPVGNISALGFSVYSFNQSVVFSRQKFGLGYGIRLSSNFSAGMKLNLLHTTIDEYNNNLSICGEIGVLFHPSSKLGIGVHVFNPTANKYSGFDNERIPSVMRVGMSYLMSEKTLFLAEFDNTSVEGFGFKGAVEYYLNEKLSFQAGLKTRYWVSSFGLRYNMKNFSVNVSVLFHQVLDSSPGISLDYISSEQ